jgi:exosortase family protein XrtF
MNLDFNFIRENRNALIFLLVFASLYLVLNTAYGFYIQHYYPSSDPFTQNVTAQVVWFISLFDPSVTWQASILNNNVAVSNTMSTVIYVFEGCNGLNVMIVYLSFLLAFKGSPKKTLVFAGGGIVAIHLLNLLRLDLLYFVALYFQSQLYFVHKYLFTGIIYALVFVLWYFWVRSVKGEQR